MSLKLNGSSGNSMAVIQPLLRSSLLFLVEVYSFKIVLYIEKEWRIQLIRELKLVFCYIMD